MVVKVSVFVEIEWYGRFVTSYRCYKNVTELG